MGRCRDHLGQIFSSVLIQIRAFLPQLNWPLIRRLPLCLLRWGWSRYDRHLKMVLPSQA